MEVWKYSSEQNYMKTKLVIFCYSLVLAFHFCITQFAFITGGFILFFMLDSLDHVNYLLEAGFHYIQVLFKTGFAVSSVEILFV
jgi:hypothetical protein